MFRVPARLLLSPVAIAILNLVILVPMVLAIVDVLQSVIMRHDFHEPLEIVTGIGVIMIGWGVALEERLPLREIFGLVGGPDEEWQVHIDHICHHVGVGELVLGLFAEVCVEIIHLPNHIINTEGLEHGLIALCILFMVVGAVVLAVHIVRMLGSLGRH